METLIHDTFRSYLDIMQGNGYHQGAQDLETATSAMGQLAHKLSALMENHLNVMALLQMRAAANATNAPASPTAQRATEQPKTVPLPPPPDNFPRRTGRPLHGSRLASPPPPPPPPPTDAAAVRAFERHAVQSPTSVAALAGGSDRSMVTGSTDSFLEGGEFEAPRTTASQSPTAGDDTPLDPSPMSPARSHNVSRAHSLSPRARTQEHATPAVSGAATPTTSMANGGLASSQLLNFSTLSAITAVMTAPNSAECSTATTPLPPSPRRASPTMMASPSITVDGDTQRESASSGRRSPDGPQRLTSQRLSETRSRCGLSYAGSFYGRPATFVTTTLVRGVDAAGFKVINQYTLLQHLGDGTSGKVKLASNLHDQAAYAIKIVKRKKVRLSTVEMHTEARIMAALHHKNIVPLVEMIDDPSMPKVFMVMPYVDGGPILHYNHNGECERSSEATIRACLRQLLGGLMYLHSKGIVHCDIKPDNLLMTKNGHVYISDFGSSSFFDAPHKNHGGSCGLGTPLFMAPELVLEKTHVRHQATSDTVAPPVDVWSLGVVVYSMLFGRHPFWATEVEDLERMILTKAVAVPHDDGVSAEGRQLVQDMLQKDPKDRITLAKLREHPWTRKRSVAASSLGAPADVGPW